MNLLTSGIALNVDRMRLTSRSPIRPAWLDRCITDLEASGHRAFIVVEDEASALRA